MLSPQKPPFWLVKKGHECPGARSARDFTTTEIHDGTWNDQHTKIYKDILSCSHPQKQLYHVIFFFILTCPIVLQCFVCIYIYNPMMGTSTLASRHPWAVPVPWTTSLELRQTAGRLKSHIEISFWLVISNMFYFPIIYGIILTIDLIFFKMLKTTNES